MMTFCSVSRSQRTIRDESSKQSVLLFKRLTTPSSIRSVCQLQREVAQTEPAPLSGNRDVAVMTADASHGALWHALSISRLAFQGRHQPEKHVGDHERQNEAPGSRRREHELTTCYAESLHTSFFSLKWAVWIEFKLFHTWSDEQELPSILCERCKKAFKHNITSRSSSSATTGAASALHQRKSVDNHSKATADRPSSAFARLIYIPTNNHLSDWVRLVGL